MMKIIIAAKRFSPNEFFRRQNFACKLIGKKTKLFPRFPILPLHRSSSYGREKRRGERKRVARRSRHLFSTFLSPPSINYLRHTASRSLSRSVVPHRPARSSLRPRSALVRCVRAREPSSEIERGEILCSCWRAFVFYCSS